MKLEHDTLFRDTVARHFPDAKIEDDEVDLGFVKIRCWVHSVQSSEQLTDASLFFTLRGGRLGDVPVFASVSGYGESPEIAIVKGACNWACAFGPLLRAALAEEDHEVERFEAKVDGQAVRVFVANLDRSFSFDGNTQDPLPAARAKLAPNGSLTRVAIESGKLPVLDATKPTIVSVFVSAGGLEPVVEVKIDGYDWPMHDVFATAGHSGDAIALLRELAVVVPLESQPLTRELVERTLGGLASQPQRASVKCPGWKHHSGTLAPPLSADVIAKLESNVGALPADYRDFLATVGASGAGPGYGLISPLGAKQASFARGRFEWEDGSPPEHEPRGVLAVAHAGCGVMWLLVLEGKHRGEVWVDAGSSDGIARRVASSFSHWYRDWLSAAVRDTFPWIQWDSDCCATAAGLRQVIETLEQTGVSADEMNGAVSKALQPGAFALASAGGWYFAQGSKLNPCQGCTKLAADFEWGEELFQPGDEPFTEPKARGWFGKLADKVRGRN